MKTFANKFTVLISCFLIWGCDSFVEVDFPSSQLTGEAVFADPASARAALGDIYAELRDNVLVTGTPNGLGVLMGLYADELQFYGSTTMSGFEFYNHNLLPTSPDIGRLWNGAYQLIYAANAVYFRAGESESLSIADKEQFQGEALFLRAYLHFYLALLYGDIPYVTTTEYLKNKEIPKTSREQVLWKVVEDLNMSKQYLEDKQPDPDRIEVDAGTAIALLARCYLYLGEWEKAAGNASEIIGHATRYGWEPELTKVFLKESTSTIWQLGPHMEGNSTPEAHSYIFTSGPPPNRALTESLVQSFEEDDLRRSQWIGVVTKDGDMWYYAHKYQQLLQMANSQEYSITFRLAEQYLIRAEARAQLNDLTGARADLNRIRQRAQLPNTTATTQQGILEAVLRERRSELFTEHGHRWFDLVRTGKAKEFLSAVKAGWRQTDVLLPLPNADLLLNPNLNPQNDGY